MHRIIRLGAIATALLILGALPGAPANAGTLSSASFTTNGSGYAVTNASNARYDWRYTTATSGTISRVETTVPAGTKGLGERYLDLPGTNGNYASSPNSSASSITGSIDLRARLSSTGWNGLNGAIISKWEYPLGGMNGSYVFRMINGYPSVSWAPNGSIAGSQTSIGSTAKPTVADGAPIWLRATFNPNDGTNAVFKFFTSSNGTNWTQLGSTQTTAPTTLAATPADVEIGATDDGGYAFWKARTYFASITSGITETPVDATHVDSVTTCTSAGVALCFNPNDYVSGSTLTSSSAQHEVWTVNKSASTYPTSDISYALSVAELAGLPNGGGASLRLIDGKAVYVLPTPTSIASGTATLLALAGFTNTATAGSYSSTITTFDNAGTPVAIDSVTTGALTFSDLAGTANVGVAVDPTFSFTVATHVGSCNSFTQTAGASSSSTGVALSRVNAGAGAIAAQDLTVGTNANTGYNLLLRSSGSLTAGSNTIADAPGTNASPAAFPATSTAAFGYTVSGLARFSNAWAGATTSNQQVMTGATVGTSTNCIAYRVQVTAATPAGTYATTAIYTAVPSF